MREQALLHELESFADAVVGKCAASLDDVEVMVVRRDVVSVLIENRTLTPELRLGQVQVALRGLKGGKLAGAATTSLDVDENAGALRAALDAGTPTPFSRFSAHRLPRSTRGFEPGLVRFARDAQALHSLAVDVRERAFAAAQPRSWIESIQGQVTALTRWQVIATRDGRASAVENAVSVSTEVNGAHAVTENLRRWPADDAFVRGVGARAVEEFPRERLTPEQLGLRPSATVAAVLDPYVVEQLFRFAAHDKFLASSRASGQSSLQVGDRVADARVTLLDTGKPDELARDFDDELTPRRETALIRAGVVGGLVSSRASALATGLPESGNGVRAPLISEPPNEAPVRDKLLGLEMAAGARAASELFAAEPLVIVPRALLGIHGADRARTAFSATVYDGVALRDGRIAGQLAPGRWNISGRVLPGDGERGLLEDAEPSRERQFTGSALMAHLGVRLTVG